MSRAYRIKVREGLSRIVRARDKVSTQLELLEILPHEQMAGLLAAELAARGFEDKGDRMIRQANGITVSVEPRTGTVTVQASAEQKMEIEREKEGVSYDDIGPRAAEVKKRLQAKLKEELEQEAVSRTASLQAEVTARLEGELSDLRRELDGAVNRATAEALKVKAAQMGRITEMTEDAATGSLTIVVEV